MLPDSGHTSITGRQTSSAAVPQKQTVKITAMARLSLRARSKPGDRTGVMVWLMADASNDNGTIVQ